MGSAATYNPRILLILILVFLTGSAAGAFGLRYLTRQSAVAKSPPSWKESGKEISLQRFKRDLDLNPDQAREVELILDDFMMYHQTLQAQMDEVRASGKERILRILNPDQRERFNRMMSDLQAKQIK